MSHYPTTPDGRYFVVRGRLWRCTNPGLPDEERHRLTRLLMEARRSKGKALRTGNVVLREKAKQAIDAAKVALGERGPVWWSVDPDLNRHMVGNTPYAAWFAVLSGKTIQGVDDGPASQTR